MEEYLDTGAIKHDDQYAQPPRIPGFLKVLCILTFVGAGLGIIGALIGILMNDFSIRSLEMNQDNPFFRTDNTAQIEMLKKYGVLAGCLNLLASGLCLAGALMMWKLKKVGYYLYVVGQLTALFVSFGLMTGASSGPFGGFAMAAQVVAALILVAFVVMYTANLKHLK